MPSFIEALGGQAAGQVVGAGLGLALGGIERKAQMKQQTKLQNLQIAGQMEMGKFNREQQMKLWEDTNYSAQMQQLKKAGLNPGLIYGMGGGAGGSTQAATGSVSGGQAAASTPAAGMGMAMGQAQLMAAQIELVKAQTKKELVGVGKGIVETDVLELQRKLADRTFEYNVEAAYEAMVQLGQQNRKLSSEADVAEGTQKEQIEIKKQELVQLGAQIALTQAEKGKVGADVANIASQIATRIKELELKGNEVEIQQQLANWETSWGKQVAQLLGNLISIIPGMRDRKKK